MLCLIVLVEDFRGRFAGFVRNTFQSLASSDGGSR